MELVTLLEKLKMDHLEAQLDAVCEQAAQEDVDYKRFLTRALEVEWQGRHRRGIETRLRQPASPGSRPWSSSISTSSPASTGARCASWPG